MPKKKQDGQLTKVKSKAHGNSKLDVEKAVELRNRGWTYKEIGQKYGITESAVHQRISHLSPDPAELAAFRKNEGNVWTSVKSRILKHVTDEKLADCSAYQLLGMAGIANQNSRLVEGQSSHNIEMVINSAMDLANEKDGI